MARLRSALATEHQTAENARVEADRLRATARLGSLRAEIEKITRQGEPTAAAAPALVERFDIEPFSEFSAE